jgi:hypothetical protein
MDWKHEHLLWEEDDTLEGSTSSVSSEVMPTDGLPVVFERGTIEIEVLFFSDILGVAADACIRGASRN